MERNKFIFYKDWWEALQKMPAEMSRAIIEAIMNYALYGIDTDNPQIAYSIYALAKAQIDRDTEKYEMIAKRNRENGKKGGRPKKTQSETNNPNNPVGNLETQQNPKNPDEPKKANNININIDNDNNIDNIKLALNNINARTRVKEASVREEEKNGAVSIDEGIAFLHQSASWIESVCRRYSITTDQAHAAVDDFADQCRLRLYDGFRSTRAASSQFIDYMQKTTSTDKNIPRNHAAKIRHDSQADAKARRDAEFAAHIASNLSGGQVMP